MVFHSGTKWLPVNGLTISVNLLYQGVMIPACCARNHFINNFSSSPCMSRQSVSALCSQIKNVLKTIVSCLFENCLVKEYINKHTKTQCAEKQVNNEEASYLAKSASTYSLYLNKFHDFRL